MILAPPQHGKTELASKRFPAYILGKRPNANVIACSYAFGRAQENNRATQQIIDSEEYQRLFPKTRLFGRNVRSVAEGTFLRNSDVFEIVNHRGAYRSAGVRGGVTGHGMNFGIIDDPIKGDEDAYSPTIRRKLLGWYQGDFFPRLRKDASIVLIMTCWHKNDLAGQLLKKAIDDFNADQWTVLSFEAERTDKKYEYDLRSPGEPLWPEFKSSKDLAVIKNTLGPVRWSAMYQQEPRAEGGSEWPESFFGRGIWFDEWPKRWVQKTVAWDPAKGKNAKWGDYSAFVKLMLSEDGLLYVQADMANDRSLDIMTHQAVEIQRVFQSHAFGIEAEQFQELLKGEVQQAGARAGILMPLYGMMTKGVNKQVRIRRLTPYLSCGQMRFKANCSSTRMLVEQLREFPNADYDDGPDALEMAVRLMNETLGTDVDDGLGNNLLQRVG